MFLPSERVHEIVEIARQDVYEYAYALFTLNNMGSLAAAIAQVADAGNAVGFVPLRAAPGLGAPEAYMAQVIHLLRFLEESDRVADIDSWYPEVGKLLRHFEDQMRHFAASTTPLTPRAELAVEIRSTFARFVCRRIGCQVQIYDMQSVGFEPRGLVSWLLVRRNKPTQLHIVYDRKTIDASTNDPLAREHRYEKIFLHELGHARLHNKYLADNAQPGGDEHVHVLPLHEVEAFTYAFTVRGLMLGMFSRVKRLLGRDDPTWGMQ